MALLFDLHMHHRGERLDDTVCERTAIFLSLVGSDYALALERISVVMGSASPWCGDQCGIGLVDLPDVSTGKNTIGMADRAPFH